MKRRLAIHTLFWLAYWLLFAYIYSRYDGNFTKYATSELFQMPARMVATYLSIWAMSERTGSKAFAGVALANVLGGLLNRVVKYFYLVPVYFPDSTIEFWNYRLAVDIFDCALVSCMVLSANMYFQQQKMMQHAAALKAEKATAELHALKAQLQPHFLFNTINNLYGLAREKSDKTAPMALKLAQLLRFVLYETQHAQIPLSREVQILKDYIELEQLRFEEDRLTVNTTWEIENPQYPIAPLLLLPLLENAFKHGAGEQRDAAMIYIALYQRGNMLRLEVENTCPPRTAEQNHGVGLQNLRRQLELIYAGAFTLNFNVNDGFYKAVLTIEHHA